MHCRLGSFIHHVRGAVKLVYLIPPRHRAAVLAFMSKYFAEEHVRVPTAIFTKVRFHVLTSLNMERACRTLLSGLHRSSCKNGRLCESLCDQVSRHP